MSFDSINSAIDAIRAGEMILLVDDEDRENEGDLVMAADSVTAEHINFMARHARGLICLTLTEKHLTQLDLPMMVSHNTSQHQTAFTVSIEAAHGVTTGISAHDRAHTVRTAVAANAKPSDLVKPGHIFPLRAQKGGVLVRTGHTEGACDLARLAGHSTAGVICEVMNDDGTMARLPNLLIFAKKHNLRISCIADLVEHRMAHESLVKRLATSTLPHPEWGEITVHAYGSVLDSRQHLAMVFGNIDALDAPLVRVHSVDPVGTVLDQILSDQPRQLEATMGHFKKAGGGVLLSMERGMTRLPLKQKVQQLNDSPPPTDPIFIQRTFGIGAQILHHLGLRKMRVLARKPRHLAGLEGYGLSVVEMVSLMDNNTHKREP